MQNKLIELFKSISPFLVASIVFWLVGSLYFIADYGRVDMNLYFYCNRSIWADTFFLYATKTAELYATLFIFVVLLFYKNAYAIYYLLLALSVSLIVYFLKQKVFGYIRPAFYIKEYLDIEAIANQKLLMNYSFPSGHTTFIFAGMCFLALLTKNKVAQIAFFIIALSCAISRVYLFQHFFIDVYVGSILGILISVFLYYITDFAWKNQPNRFIHFSSKDYIYKRCGIR